MVILSTQFWIEIAYALIRLCLSVLIVEVFNPNFRLVTKGIIRG